MPGCVWTRMDTGAVHGYLEDAWGSSAQDVFTVGASGIILHYDGTNWITMNSGTRHDLKAVWGSSSTDVWAVGDSTPAAGGPILHYDGSTWTRVVGGEGSSDWYSLNGIWGSSASDVFAVGCSGERWPAILHYDGRTWTAIDTGGPHCLYDIWGSSASDVFAVGENVILHYDGATWSRMSSIETYVSESKSALFCDIWGASESDLFVVDYFRGILRYDGAQWSCVDVDNYQPAAVWGASGHSVFLVGSTESTQRGILHYDGASWSLMESPEPEGGLYGIWGSDACSVFAVGGGVLRLGTIDSND